MCRVRADRRDDLSLRAHAGVVAAARADGYREPRQAAPASYEYTVRMGDGSSHLFREEMPMSWRQGERLMFIEGSDPLN